MYEQMEKSKENKRIFVANSVVQKKRIDKKDRKCNGIQQSSGVAMMSNRYALDSTDTVIIQRALRVGFVPATPGNFRGAHTTIFGIAGTAYDGGKGFTNKNAVINNNSQAGTLTVSNTDNAYNISDASNTALFNPTTARDVAPEVDHIVEKSEGGANDLSNARVVSKGENTDNTPLRPTNAQKRLALYEDLNVDVLATSTRMDAGTTYNFNSYDRLSVADINMLRAHKGLGTVANQAAVTKTVYNKMRGITKNVTKNDIRVY
ncbi:HNH endonuclease [Pseudoalteromonas sp. MMG005]|uniref:HNH endonuclease n=1 Tax=Pseudoalteromonas sp. MMG005 TaxID=2822682 RepID=UPI001B3A09F4|nr:HNH endonuclease [Pseudoalteromonas sp. MMG005]MBQ4845277.1 hypothetical protein [Pseudoalteromonas sp. MMG005]